MKRYLVIALVLGIPFLVLCSLSTDEQPVADFTAEPLSGNAPLKVTFTDLSAGDPDSWKWYFGDGYHSGLQNPTYTYDTAGIYDVTLIVTNVQGTDTAYEESYIRVVSDSQFLGANFTAEPTSGPPPLEVQFTDHSTGNPTSYFWDFGDEKSSVEQNPVHTYEEAGSYNVTLVVSDEECFDTLRKESFIVIEDVEYRQITENGITLKWKTDNDNLYVIISAATTGWVSVGFDPLGENHKDANIIIGYVKEGIPWVEDHFGTGQLEHAADTSLGGTDDVFNVTGTEEAGITQISFGIPLDSGDDYDKKLIVGESYKVILAHGPDGSDDFVSRHLKTVIVSITI
ncbi:PKD domain-containing protein [candidate division WOR-3 bacterium]|uniref:PKD domain-containing protein n=1 Tax=candidate division WOR-3 bacterium TaxID=2052148 RepID=A0A9D5K913_UNCW3|nr:PKD domain-containing protein [candidate division WOR-3 bacterium]MBD3364683.1 PKD domain-containing protein [candidate division WOR-3 bacterium]